MVRVIYNRVLGGWYIVRGPHDTPLGGRFETKEAARAWLRRNARVEAERELWAQLAVARD